MTFIAPSRRRAAARAQTALITGLLVACALSLISTKTYAQSGGFHVMETPYQPLVAGSRYGLSNTRDIFEYRGASTGVFYEDTDQLVNATNTTLPKFSVESGVNDGGIAAGIGVDNMGPFAFWWLKGTVTKTGRPVRPDNVVGAIDRVFTAAGQFIAGQTPVGSWKWDGTTFTWLKTPGSSVPAWNSTATGINNSGVVCGYSRILDVYRPAIWESDIGTFLTMPGGYVDVRPVAINDSKQVVGVATSILGSIGLRWEPNGQVFSLGPFATPIDNNNLGEIIGTRIENGITRQLIWRGGVSFRINSLLLDDDYSVLALLAINDQGEILARVLKESTNQTRLAILIPSDEEPGDTPRPPATLNPLLIPKQGGDFSDNTWTTKLNNQGRKNAPAFTVTGLSPIGMVRIYADDILIAEQRGTFGSFIARGNGREVLPDGLYTVFGSQVINGIEGEKKAFFSLAVDSVAPTTPDAPDLAPESDTGPSNSDDVTGATSLKFNGLDVAGNLMQILVNGKPDKRTDPVTVAQDGTYTITLNRPKRGTKRYSVQAIDKAGNMSPKGNQLLVTVLTGKVRTPAKLEVSDADRVTLPGQRKLQATFNPSATIVGRGIPNNHVRLFADGIEAGTGTVAGNKEFSIQLTRTLSVGQHDIRAEQIDLVGNVSRPSKVMKLLVIANNSFALAEAQQIAASQPDDTDYILDVNDDGIVSIADARYVLAFIGDDIYPDEADVDSDGDVDVDDLRLITDAISNPK